MSIVLFAIFGSELKCISMSILQMMNLLVLCLKIEKLLRGRHTRSCSRYHASPTTSSRPRDRDPHGACRNKRSKCQYKHTERQANNLCHLLQITLCMHHFHILSHLHSNHSSHFLVLQIFFLFPLLLNHLHVQILFHYKNGIHYYVHMLVLHLLHYFQNN